MKRQDTPSAILATFYESTRNTVSSVKVATARRKATADLEALIATREAAARKEVAKNALIIAEYWLEEDGRPKHLIQDLWDVEDISVLDHIDKEYIEKYRPAAPQNGEKHV